MMRIFYHIAKAHLQLNSTIFSLSALTLSLSRQHANINNKKQWKKDKNWKNARIQSDVKFVFFDSVKSHRKWTKTKWKTYWYRLRRLHGHKHISSAWEHWLSRSGPWTQQRSHHRQCAHVHRKSWESIRRGTMGTYGARSAALYCPTILYLSGDPSSNRIVCQRNNALFACSKHPLERREKKPSAPKAVHRLVSMGFSVL